jgi:hypothetical protein
MPIYIVTCHSEQLNTIVEQRQKIVCDCKQIICIVIAHI